MPESTLVDLCLATVTRNLTINTISDRLVQHQLATTNTYPLELKALIAKRVRREHLTGRSEMEAAMRDILESLDLFVDLSSKREIDMSDFRRASQRRKIFSDPTSYCPQLRTIILRDLSHNEDVRNLFSLVRVMMDRDRY